MKTMCDPNDNSTDLILDGYGNIDGENKSYFSESDIISATDPTKSVLDLSIMGIRKRKAQDLFTYPKDYKVQRKSVEKIHLSVNSPSLHPSSNPRPESVFLPEQTLTEDEEDPEKYLTNSSKRNKQPQNRKKENDRKETEVSRPEVQMFESSNVQVVTDECGNLVMRLSSLPDNSDEDLVKSLHCSQDSEDSFANNDYGDLVVTLYPSQDSEQNVAKDQSEDVSVSSQSSYLKEDQPTSIFLSSDYLNTENTTPTSAPAIQNSDENVVYSVSPTSTTSSSQSVRSKSSTKSSTKSPKQNFSPGATESVKDPVRNVWVTVKSHKEQLKQCGHTWTKGTWSNEEVQILRHNIEVYCEKNNIKNVVDLIYTSDKETRKDFYPSLCVGLNRPLFAVYRRVKRMFDKKNYKGKYSEEEVNKLKELRKIYGHDWSVIGQELGRSSDSVKDRCRLIKEDLASGRWTAGEESKLDFAVHAVTNTSLGESVTEGVSWPLVAEIVKTRTEKQCRTKWLNYLNWKRMQGDQWTKNDDKLLVEKIFESGAVSENDVIWSKLCVGWKSARSPQWLRLKWNGLKKLLPEEDAEKVSFKETVAFLKRHFATPTTTRPWEKSKKTSNNKFKQSQGKYHKISAADLESLRNSGVQILSKEDLEQDDSGNITTSIISQSDDTTSAPLFIQTTDPDHLVSQELLDTSSDVGNPHESSLKFRLQSETTDSDGDKQQFPDSLICEGENQFPIGTFRLTSTSANGIYIIQAADATSNDEVTLTDDDRSINIHLPPDVLSTMLKIDTSKLATDVTEETSSCANGDVTFDGSAGSVYLTESTDSPVLGSVAHDITIGSPSSHTDSTSCCLLQEAGPLAENLL